MDTVASHNLYVEWVEGPLVDGATVYRKRLGAFNRNGKVLKPPAGALEPTVGLIPKDARRLRFLLVPLDRKKGVTIVLDADRNPVGEIDHGESETPWPGVAPEACRFKLGDTVGLVGPDNAFRLGIVAGVPLSKEEVERFGGKVETWDGGTYLVMHDPGASTHLHLREPMLIPVDADAVAPNRVRRRFERSQPRKPMGGSLVSTHKWEVEEANVHHLEEWFSTLPEDEDKNHLGVRIEDLWFHGSAEDLRACIADVAKRTGLSVQKVRGNCIRAFGPR